MFDVSFVEFFQRSLRLPSDWSVIGVREDEVSQRIYVEVGYRGSQAVYDHQPERQWRHLDVCQYQSFIVARLPRIRSASGAIETLEVPWADPKQRITHALESRVLDQVLEMKNRQAASRLLRMHPSSMLRICLRATERGMERRELRRSEVQPIIRYIGIDEKCYGQPRKMATIVTDTERKIVLAVVDGHSQASAEEALRQALTPEQRVTVQGISMDLWDPFAAAARTILPQVPIVHDKYHLERLNQKAVDLTRRQEVHRIPELKGKRFWLLRHAAARIADHQAFFDTIHQLSSTTARTWQASEDFRAIYKLETMEDARSYLQDWIDQYCITPIRPLRRLVESFERAIEGIVNYFDHRITNAIAERINGKIQEIKLLAKGFRSFEHFKLNVLFYLGNLDIYPQKSK